MTRRRDHRGAATILTVAMAGLLLLVGAAAGVVGAIVAAHRGAQSAADLAALAGAAAVAGHAGGDPCATAGEVAVANGARLVSCAVEDADVVVEVTVRGPRWLGQDQDLSARARAGPEPSRAGPW
jgi:secretion/DNA translocation related TadE-like protein